MPNNNLSAELSAADRRTGEANAANGSIASNDVNRRMTGGRRGRNTGQRRGAGPRTGMTLRSNRNNPANHHEYSLDTNSIIDTSRAENLEEIERVVQTAMQAQQLNLRQELSDFIRAQVANMQIASSAQAPSRRLDERQGQSGEAHSAGTVYHDIHPNAQRVSRSSSAVQPEKVPNIIQSWHIKFDGSKDGLQTEEFLYRVQALAQQNLNVDRQLLCDHLHLFFVGKASDWYWKFHRSCHQFNWIEFCREFRNKFKESDNDMDIWEFINSKRQAEKEEEFFEDYQFQVERLVSRLSTSISEESLVRLLIRHSKPSLRYELMHLRIVTLAQLIEEVRTHEQFCRQRIS